MAGKRSAWHSPALFAMAAALVVAFTTIWFLAFRAQDRDILRITALDGAVRWTGRGGEVRDGLKPGESLPGGQLEALSDDSTVTLAFEDKTTLTLLSHSTATLSDDGQKRVHLRAGNLSAEVRPQPQGRPMLIHTATAVLEVLGTRFDVESGAAATRLNVAEGTVRMTRLVDGSTVDVRAEHQVVASLSRAEKLAAVKRRPPALSWRSDLSQGAQGAEGEWLPAVGEAPARLRALPKLVNSPKRGPVTLHSASFAVPWEYLQTLQLKPDSRLRVRGRMTTLAPVEIMLSTKRAGGGFAGNYFVRPEPDTNQWQLDLPVTAFRKWSTDGGEALPDGLQLRRIVLYTIGTDAGLEIEQVEVVQGAAH
jgi:hypothetical protein